MALLQHADLGSMGMARKRIGILTGGGDVPGLNAIIKTVTYRGSEDGIEVVGLRRGWEALTHLNLEDPTSRSHYLIPLNRENTRTIDRRGGTVLHSSRTNPSKMKKLPDHLVGTDLPVTKNTNGGTETTTWDLTGKVLANLSGLGIEHLIAIGGDDTLSYAVRLNELGVKIIAIPKTMDNDVRNTEYCIGFSTAITRASDAIQRQRTTVGSHERIGIFRVFGRDAGFSALYTAYATSIRCVIPEYTVDLDKLIQLLLEEKRANPSNYALIVLSEGAEWEGYKVQEYGQPDPYGHRKKASVAEALADEIKRHTGEETISATSCDLKPAYHHPRPHDRKAASASPRLRHRRREGAARLRQVWRCPRGQRTPPGGSISTGAGTRMRLNMAVSSSSIPTLIPFASSIMRTGCRNGPQGRRAGRSRPERHAPFKMLAYLAKRKRAAAKGSRRRAPSRESSVR
jgi:ATP-dependent phosphofructokinase / diphosphate-dependent phosphofructokinase